jgi:hypothetical protein
MASALVMIVQPTNLFVLLVGQTAQGCWLGYGSVLFPEFGATQPPRERETHPRGELGLSCDLIEWRIEQRDNVLVGSEDDRVTMESGIRQIDGRSLVSAEVFRHSGDSVLTFSDDLVLHTFVISSEEDARWNFRDRKDNYFHLGPDRAYPEEQAPLQALQGLR